MVIQWQSLEHTLTETLTLDTTAGGIEAHARLQGVLDDASVDLTYRLALTPDWRWVDFSLCQGETLFFKIARTELPGMPPPFIDFILTPFTNTLPIRHLALQAGETRLIEVCYIDYPDPKPAIEQQEYTRLDTSRYRFRQLHTGFEAVVTVDAAGLVTDYPGLFRRIS